MRLDLILILVSTLTWDNARAQSSITPTISRPTSAIVTSVRPITTTSAAITPSSLTSARASTAAGTSSSAVGSNTGSNTNLTILFQPITLTYACSSRSFSWVLPADLSSASRATLIDLFITNENIDQVIPAESGSSSSSGSVASSSAIRSSSAVVISSSSSSSAPVVRVSSSTAVVVRPTTAALSSAAAVRPTSVALASIARTSSTAIIRASAVVARHARGGDSLAITAQGRRARHLVSRATPSGSEIVDRNLTVVTASSNQYTYAPFAVGKGRYVIYATAHGDKTRRLGTSNVFTVLNGADASCVNGTGSGSSDAEGPSSSSVSGGTVAGIVVGAIAGTLLLAFLAFWFWRKKQKKSLWISQSSRRMFDGESSGWKGGAMGFLGRRGGSKRMSQRSFAVGGFNEHSNSGHSTEPDSAASSAWRSPTGYGGHPVRPSDPGYLGGYGGEPKDEEEEKHEFGTYRNQRDGQTIELTRLQTQQQDAFGRGGVGLNIPVLNKQPDDRHRLSFGYRPSPGGNDVGDTTDTSTPSTVASPQKSWDGQRSPLEVESEHRQYPDDFTISSQASRQNSLGEIAGLQRNASTASTTLGTGAGIGRSISQKRQSGGLPGSTKRKPVPMMDKAGSPSTLETQSPPELGTPLENGQETLADTRPGTPLERVHRQDSQASLSASSTSGTIRPGLGNADRSRRSSFLLMPDRPLDQD